MDPLTIGRMASLNQVSEQTLRLYDKMNLLKPKTVAGNNYRFYDIKQCAKLDLIQYMKSLGMTLNEIKGHLDKKDMNLIKGILKQREEQIEEEIKELKYKRKAIERTLTSIEIYEAVPPDGTIALEFMGKRYMYCIDSRVNIYDHGIDMYEKVLRDLKTRLISDRLPQTYFCNTGTVLHLKDLLKRNFYSTEVFVFVDKEDVEKELVKEIPSHMYLSIYCDKFENEVPYAKRLLEEIEAKGYTPCGDYLCEAISDIPFTDGKERGMYLRLQIPIKY